MTRHRLAPEDLLAIDPDVEYVVVEGAEIPHVHPGTEGPLLRDLRQHLYRQHGATMVTGTERVTQALHRKLHRAEAEPDPQRRLDVEARGSGHPSRPGTIHLVRPTMAELMDLIDQCQHTSVWRADPDNEG